MQPEHIDNLTATLERLIADLRRRPPTEINPRLLSAELRNLAWFVENYVEPIERTVTRQSEVAP